MKDRIKNILSNEYNFNIDQLNSLEGGYFPDEIYLLITSDQQKYLIKYIQYSFSLKHLELILKFENLLHNSYSYPCPEIILSINQQLVIFDNNRFLFVQTFIQGIEPTKEILDKDKTYLHQMGCLLGQWRIASHQYLSDIHLEENQELTDKWWEKQQIDNIDPFLLSNFIECKQYLINLNGNFQHGLIHNDFHTNNSILTNNGTIFIIDFIDACQSVFIADLATSLFHLLIDEQNGEHRVKIFLQGYQQIISLTLEEIDSLDIFVRLKLTLSIIQDLRNSNNINDPFIQSCFLLLQKLNKHSTLFLNNVLKIIEYYDKKEKQIELQRKIQYSNLANANRLSILKVRDDYVQTLKEESRKQLLILTQDQSKYPTILANLITQGLLVLIEPTVILRCRYDDYVLVQRLISDVVDRAGGVEFYALNGKIKVTNTIEARQSMIFDQMLPEIRQKLFDLNQNRKYED